MWEQIIALLLAAFVGWWLYRTIKGNKAAFSKENFFKTARTMGLLAIGLILLIAFCVMMLR